MTITANIDFTSMEPAISRMLDSASQYRAAPPYQVKTVAEVEADLSRFFREHSKISNPKIHRLQPLGGGASKEQFVFELSEDGAEARKYVLRMDPLESAIVTCRRREAAILALAQDALPTPSVLWADFSGDKLGRPSIITNFIDGVTKPSASDSNISGFGTSFNTAARNRLGVALTQHLVALHNIDWRQAPADLFQAPTQHPQQAALWQVNWWSRVWRDDRLEGHPLMALAECWLRANLPSIENRDISFVHSDFRTGNFLYHEETLNISAILDWELIHIGDFHEDLAWIALKSWSTEEQGVLLASGLLPFDELCALYAQQSGRTINHKTLHFYQVLALYKCAAVCLATSTAAARRQHNHQDIVLTWLATAGYSFLADLQAALSEGETA